MLLAGLVLFTQILGATLAGASVAGPTLLELCVGRGATAVAAVDPDAPSSDGDHAGLCDGCLVGCCRVPLPNLASVERGLEAPAAQPPPWPPDAAPAPPVPRALRPPGRAPPALS